MKKIFFLLLISIIISSNSYAQQILNTENNQPQTDYKYDAKLLLHYTAEELNEIRNTDPDSFAAIEYWHLNSYSVVITDPSNPVQYLFNLDEFDITRYENQRKLEDPLVLNFEKHGIEITLIPYNQLQHMVPLQEFMYDYLLTH